MIRLAAALLLGLTTAASAAVVERVSPVLPSAPVPALSFTMSGPMSASFTPALTGTMNAPSLASPSPILVQSIAAPVNSMSVIVPAPALAAHTLSAPSAERHERGPPDARAAGFSTFVAKSVADTVRDWVVPSDELLEDHDALIVGENHESLASVNELTRALPGLAKAGVTVLGIEGLKRHNQAAVDDYFTGAAALPAEVLAFSPRRRASFEALLKSARDAGVRVVALGMPLDQWARQAAELAAEKTGDPVESFQRSPGDQLYRAQTNYEPGYNEAVAEVYLTRRNKSMASFLSNAMEVGAKAVVLVGQNHIDGADAPKLMHIGPIARWGTMGKELARLGLKAFSLTLTGGLFLDADGAAADRDIRRASYQKAAAGSPDGSPIYMRTGVSSGLYHAGGRVPGSMVAH